MKIGHLKKTTEFRDVFRTGRKLKGEKLAAYVKLFSQQGGFSVGVVIPKKVVPLATKRNYIRRIVYAFFSKTEKCIPQRGEIVIRAVNIEKNSRRKELFNGITKDLTEFLRQVKQKNT